MASKANNFFVSYVFHVYPEKEAQFLEAWSKVTAEVRLRFESFGSNLHRVDGGFFAYAQWPSEDSWRSFWANREHEVAGLTELRECLSQESEVLVLRLVSSSLKMSPASFHSLV